MRDISIDTAKVKGKHNKMFRECVGSGRAHEGLYAEHQAQLAMVHRECGFKYLRFHALLIDDMAVYSEDSSGNPIYNWQYIDLVYDYILSIGMKPFVEISFMPQALASGTKTIFWWKGNVTPPKSYQKWGDFIYELVLHFERRYGRDEVLQWYFEVWNEPDLNDFFSGDMTEYFKLYDVTARAVKRVFDGYRVGGPATSEFKWIDEFLDYCIKNKAPVDFIATHTYGTVGSLDEMGVRQLYLDNDPDSIVKGIRSVHEKVKASPLPDLEIHITEWSTSFSSRDPVHDSYHSAAFILSKLKRCETYVGSMSYWVFTDIFEEAGPPPSPFHGGFGLLNTQGLRKPSFYAYKFLNRLGDTELVCDDRQAWVCKDGSGIQALIWDYDVVNQDAPSQAYFKRDLPPKVSDTAELSIENLEPGEYLLTVCSTGYRQNDVYTAFVDMNVQGALSFAQVEELHKKSSGEPMLQQQVVVGKDGLFTRKVDMQRNDVFLVVLERV